MLDITPLIADERADEPDGLWATKQYGDFKEGDCLRAEDYVTGSVEVRQLRSVFKLSFQGITRVNRFRASGAPEMREQDDEGDSTSSAADARKAAREEAAVRLHVFLSRKKGKTRMADLEETAFLLRLDVGTEGCICFGKSYGDFDQGLLQVPHPTGYKGVVIAKRRADEPKTEEPIVYGYAPIVQKRRPVVASEVALGLAEDKDRATRYAKAAPAVKTDEDLLKGARKYTRTARKAWEAMSIPEDQEINFSGFKLAFDELNLVILESRALRLFKLCDLDGSGMIGISELEVALMIHDVVPTTSYVTPRDSFHIFDLDGGGDISWLEFKEAADVMSAGDLTEAKARDLFEKADTDKSGVIDYGEFLQVWLEMANVEQELKVRGKKAAFGPLSKSRNKRLLLKAVQEEDRAAEYTFQVVRARVDNVRKKARLLRDQRKRRRAATGGKSTLADASEDASKRRQRRLMLQKEQAERAKRRLEQKIKQNELQQQLAAKKDRDIAQVKKRIVQQEKDRIAGIRARGDDQLSLSHLSLRQVPEQYYRGEGWSTKLVDVILVDLQDNRITELPNNFLSNMVSLRKLVLSKNRLCGLADEQVANLGNLQVLDLSRNKLRSLPASVGKLTKLQHLNLSKNEIGSLPDELGQMHALRCLRAHSNDLETVPAEAGSLVSLESCDLSCNRLLHLPNDLSYATSLTRLKLSSNRLRHLPLDFGHLFSLQVLDVSCNHLADLPTSVSTLQSLQVLRAGENALVEVTAAWGGMSSLVDLEAPTNRIGRVAPEIGGLLQLQRLNLHRNLVEDLPPEIGLLTKLHDVNLHSNRLARIPDEMGALVRLNRLCLAHNRLEWRLTDHLGLLTSLTDLDLSCNSICNLPPSLGALDELETLNASKNMLGTLPQDFTFLTSLNDLDLSCNRFKDLPLVLCGMQALQRLDMTSNVISYLPREIGAMTMLTKLHLKHNVLKSLPLEVMDLEDRVHDLNFEQNPLTMLPDKWHVRFGPKEQVSRPAGYTTREVFEWMRAQRKIHEDVCHEWDEKAGLYLTGRASATEFVDGVRRRVGEGEWRPYLEVHVLRSFFRAKKTGFPDAYEKLTDEQLQERRHVRAELASQREDKARLCVSEADARRTREAAASFMPDLRSAAALAEDRRLHRLHHVARLGRPLAMC